MENTNLRQSVIKLIKAVLGNKADFITCGVERIELKDVFYMVDDDRHFVVSTNVEISDQFFAWICGFRKRAKIVSPPEVVESMKRFLNDVYGRYETE